MLPFKYFSYLDLKIVKQYAIAFGFSIIGALINFYFFRQVFHHIGEESFYYYAYSRRIISFASPVLLLGLGISLPRAMGLYRNDSVKQQRLFLLTILFISVISSLWVVFNFFLNNSLTQLFWGEESELTLKLSLVLSFFLFGTNVSAVIHAYYRGKINALMSGVIELLVQSLIPLFAFVILSDLIKIYSLIAGGIILFNILMIVLMIRKFDVTIKNFINISELKELMDYGIRRVPGDFFYAMIIFLPAFFAGRFFGVEFAGVVSFGLSLLTLFNLPATAISFVTLSRSAQLLSTSKSRLKKETYLLLVMALAYSFVVLVVCYFFLSNLLALFFDTTFIKHSDYLFAILLALPMLVAFTVYRSITDSAFKRSYNSMFMFIALLVFILFAILARFLNDPSFILYGNITVYSILAVSSFVISRKIFRI